MLPLCKPEIFGGVSVTLRGEFRLVRTVVSIPVLNNQEKPTTDYVCSLRYMISSDILPAFTIV